jgi:hypothetical protein
MVHNNYLSEKNENYSVKGLSENSPDIIDFRQKNIQEEILVSQNLLDVGSSKNHSDKSLDRRDNNIA